MRRSIAALLFLAACGGTEEYPALTPFCVDLDAMLGTSVQRLDLVYTRGTATGGPASFSRRLELQRMLAPDGYATFYLAWEEQVDGLVTLDVDAFDQRGAKVAEACATWQQGNPSGVQGMGDHPPQLQLCLRSQQNPPCVAPGPCQINNCPMGR